MPTLGLDLIIVIWDVRKIRGIRIFGGPDQDD